MPGQPVLEQGHASILPNPFQIAMSRASQTGTGACESARSSPEEKKWLPGSARISLRTPGRRVLSRCAPGNRKNQMFCDARSAAPSSRRIWRGSASDRGGGRIRIARRRVPQSITNTTTFGTVCVSGCCGAFKAQNEMCDNLQSFCNDSGPPPISSAPLPLPKACGGLSLSLSLFPFLWLLRIPV